MDIFDMIKNMGIEAKDIPMLSIPEEQVLLNYFHTRKKEHDITFKELGRKTNISYERLLEINQEISLHFKHNLAPKALYKAMLNAKDDDNAEFEQFFQRIDVDLCCSFLFYIIDIKNTLGNPNTPQYQFLYDNWKKYRGY